VYKCFIQSAFYILYRVYAALGSSLGHLHMIEGAGEPLFNLLPDLLLYSPTCRRISTKSLNKLTAQCRHTDPPLLLYAICPIYMLHAIVYMLHVTCDVLYATSYTLYVTCYMLSVKCCMIDIQNRSPATPKWNPSLSLSIYIYVTYTI